MTLTGTRKSEDIKNSDLKKDGQFRLPRKTASEIEVLPDGTTIIDEAGDLILSFRAATDSRLTSFRVSSSKVSATSPYFDNLVLNTRFAEGQAIAKKHEELKAKHSEIPQAPINELPAVEIIDVGQISSVKTIQPLMRDMLLILHNRDLSTTKMPPSSLANLAIVADRFDCAAAIGKYVQAKGLISSCRRRKNSGGASEETIRQKLLVGLVFGDLLHNYSADFACYSRDLMLMKSERWNIEHLLSTSEALWWCLPRGLEEEIHYRRRCIMKSISNLQSHLLRRYTSRERQCRLGYDTSPQCDSFQCGEFVKFLSRHGLALWHSGFEEIQQGDTFVDSVESLMATFRQCPSYQVNSNHSHCGPRRLLLHGLNTIQQHLATMGVGVCLECWTSQNSKRSWSDGRALPIWSPRGKCRMMMHQHDTQGVCRIDTVRDFFTSVDRLWGEDLNLMSSSS